MSKQYSSFSDVSDDETSTKFLGDKDFFVGDAPANQKLTARAITSIDCTNGVSINQISPRKNTKKTTSYGRRAFCDWWDEIKQSFQFDEHKFPSQDFRDRLRELDGVSLFMELTHIQRASVLRGFVAGVKPRKTGDPPLSAKTIKAIVDGFVRHLKEIEAESDILYEKYGDWSWTKGKVYGIVKDALKSYSMHRFSQLSQSVSETRDTSASDSLRLFAFAQIKTHTLKIAACSQLFRERLLHLQKATIQVIGQFCGSRAISEMNEIKVTDFIEHGLDWLEFKPSGVTKTTKVDSNFTVSSRVSSFLVGRSNCDLIRLLASHRSNDAPNRLFLRPLNNVLESHEFWFANQNVGINQISGAIKDYTPVLIENQLIPEGKYTNTSMRKLVVDRLSDAGCPEMLVASAIGHYGSNSSSVGSGFMHKNLVNYSTGVNDVLTRKKIAMLMHNPRLKWRDVEDDETFFCQKLSDPKLIDCTPLVEVLNKHK